MSERDRSGCTCEIYLSIWVLCRLLLDLQVGMECSPMKRSLMGRAGWVLTDERRIEGHNLCGFEKAPLLPFRVIKTWDAHELEHYGIAAEGSGKCALTEKKYLWKCVNFSSFGAFYFCRCMNRNVIKPSMDFLIYFFVKMLMMSCENIEIYSAELIIFYIYLFFVIFTEAEAYTGTGWAEDSLPFSCRPRISRTG